MTSPDKEIRESPTLGSHFRRAFRDMNRRRPISVYLMIAIFAVVLLGSQVVYIWEDPKRLALFLSLNFLFFFVVAYRAIVDFFEIIRGHFREGESVFRDTLGDEEFVKKLGQKVRSKRGD